MIFGPIAFLAWAYLWRTSHRGATTKYGQHGRPNSSFTSDVVAPSQNAVAPAAVTDAIGSERVRDVFGTEAPMASTKPLSEPEAQRQEALARRAPGWLDVTAFGLFTGGWIFMGAMWNLRYAGMALAISVMAGLVYVVVRWKLKYMPDLSAELSRQSRFRRGAALLSSAAVFVVAIGLAAAFQLLFWNFWNDLHSQDWPMKMPFAANGAEARSTFQLDKLKSLAADRAADIRVMGGGGTFGPPRPGSMSSWVLRVRPSPCCSCSSPFKF